MADEEKKGAAVYVGWTTFKNALDQLAQALPNRIDRTCFPGQAGGVQSQLLAALKFLDLIDDDGKPTRSLQSLADADSENARKEQFKKILETQYSKLFALDLTKTTPGELAETMGASYNVTGDTRAKAIRFFIAAVSWLNIPMSKLLLKGTPNAPNTTGTAPRRRRVAARTRGNADEETEDDDESEDETPPSSGTARTVNLQSGGTLTISVSLDVLRLSSSDRQFVFGLIDKLEEYESKTSAAEAS
jgi:hypothetical protein